MAAIASCVRLPLTEYVSVERYGIDPGKGVNWERDHPDLMRKIYAKSCEPRTCIVWPAGHYPTSINLTGEFSGSKMRFEGATFGGILHLTENIEDVEWSGDVSSYDRMGLDRCFDSRLPDRITMLNDPEMNVAQPGVGNRGIHILASHGITWGEMIVEDTAPTQEEAPGAVTIWAGVAIQCQGHSGIAGRIHVKNASGHGVLVNALDVDLDIMVDGYGRRPLQFGERFIQGTDGKEQSQQGCGVWLNRCTGRVSLDVDQCNPKPEADTYSVLFDETGLSTLPETRDRPLIVERLAASVGNGNRGVAVGDVLNPSPFAHVHFARAPSISLRQGAEQIEPGFDRFNIVAGPEDQASVRTVTGAV